MHFYQSTDSFFHHAPVPQIIVCVEDTVEVFIVTARSAQPTLFKEISALVLKVRASGPLQILYHVGKIFIVGWSTNYFSFVNYYIVTKYLVLSSLRIRHVFPHIGRRKSMLVIVVVEILSIREHCVSRA